MIDLRNYRVSSQKFYKKTGFRAKKSVSQAYKSFNNFLKKTENSIQRKNYLVI